MTFHAKAAILGDAVVADVYLRASGQTIDWVRAADEVHDSEKEGAVDLADCTLVPGLIDSHTHLSLFADGRAYEEMAGESDARMLAAAVGNAGIHLRAGVTTVRDNGARNDVAFVIRDMVASGAVVGPDILASGRPITRRGGHFHWCNGVADGVEEIADLARDLIRQGADHLKIMATGGGTASSDPTRTYYSTEELSAVAEVARVSGKLTTAHCRATEGIRRAVAGGLDCIEHAEFLEPGGVIKFDEPTAEFLADSPLYVSPTLQAFGHYRLKHLRAAAESGMLTPAEGKVRDQLERHLEQHLQTFRNLSDMGMRSRLIFGSDAGPHITEFGDPAFGLQLMVDGGMTCLEAIHAATSVPARALGLSDRGALEAGKKADFVAVRGDPTADIRAIRDVKVVYKDGHRVT